MKAPDPISYIQLRVYETEIRECLVRNLVLPTLEAVSPSLLDDQRCIFQPQRETLQPRSPLQKEAECNRKTCVLEITGFYGGAPRRSCCGQPCPLT